MNGTGLFLRTSAWRVGAFALMSGLAGAAGVAGCGGGDSSSTGPFNTGGSGTGTGTGGSTGTMGTGGSTGTMGTGGSTGTMGTGTGGSSVCGPGATLCGASCTVLDFDPNNCGACGTACAQGEVCSQGMCGSVCAGGTTNCNGVCVNTTNDPGNCGSCGSACAAGEVCSMGMCSSICGGNTKLCGTTCADIQNDPSNCGDCNIACAAGEVCSQGMCGLNCAGGTTQCGTKCVDTTTDEANCGMCGQACQQGQVCSNGTCGGCPSGLSQCNNTCVNTSNDPLHCGNCTTACPGGSSCINGMCQACDSNTTDCDGDGWLASEGDCCDKPGACGSEPEKVNPGAIEVVGNGVDDNCNGKTDLFDTLDTISCDANLMSDSMDPIDYAKAIGICRQTTANPPKAQRTWGLLDAQIQRADGSALGDVRALSIRGNFGNTINPTEGSRMVVMSSGIAADATQTMPGPNGGAPMGTNVSTTHSPASSVDITTCTNATCIKDWFQTANPPLKQANQLPVAPNCGSGTAGSPNLARDSAMLVLTLRAPTNTRAFSFNSYFFSAEYPEFVCSNFNDQYIALVNTPGGIPTPIANPIDKNLMTYTANNQKWPIGINIANGTSLFSVCESQMANPGCWDTSVNTASCSLGAMDLAGTGFEAGSGCPIGGGTFWLTTAGNVIPGDTVELRIAIWDVGDTAYDSLSLLDGFQWLANATLPGTN